MIGVQLAYKAPETLKEALDLLGREGHQVLTADQSLVSGLKKGIPALHTLVSLRKIPSLATLNQADNELRIGTSVTYNALLTNPILSQYPMLAQALATVSDPHLRHHSTIGGAIYHGGRIHAPVLAALMAMDATAVVLTRQDDMRLPVHSFSQQGHRVSIPSGSLLTMIVVPATVANQTAYQSLHQLAGRPAHQGIAVSIAGSGQEIDQIRLVLAGFTEQPVRLYSVEQRLVGNALTPATIQAAMDQLNQEKLPMPEENLDEGYQRHLAGVALKRALLRLTTSPVVAMA